MRTNMEIDDELMADALDYSGLSTKRAVVEQALRELVRRGAGRRLLELADEGVDWRGPDEEWPAPKHVARDDRSANQGVAPPRHQGET